MLSAEVRGLTHALVVTGFDGTTVPAWLAELAGLPVVLGPRRLRIVAATAPAGGFS